MSNNDKIKSINKEFLPFENKNRWTIEYEDNLIEEKDLPTFIDRCDNCGDWINKMKTKERQCSNCCNECVEKCKKTGCQLK